MEENNREESDPPPDSCATELFLEDDLSQVYDNDAQEFLIVRYSAEREEEIPVDYSSMILPNEDYDPEYFKNFLDCYRHIRNLNLSA